MIRSSKGQILPEHKAVPISENLQSRMRFELDRIATSIGRPLADRFKTRSYRTDVKDDRSIVSDADLEVQDYIVSRLRATYPGIPIVAEEGDLGNDPPAGCPDFFVVDPIDGSANFCIGLPLFFISIAYVSLGSPQVAVLHNPILGLTYHAMAHRGANLNGRAIHTAPYQPLDRCQVHVNVRQIQGDLSQRIIDRVARKARKVRSLGCVTADLTLVASGATDAVVGHHLATWDVAAAALILEESGGIISQANGAPIRYDKVERFSIVATGTTKLHEEILDIIRT